MGLPESTPEIERDYMQAFGPELGPVYHRLYREVLSLHWKWAQFQKLFTRSAERIGLLNSTAPGFFYVVQDVLWDDILLQIAVLTDSPEQGSNRNLSLFCLPGLLADRQLAQEITRTLESAKPAAQRVRNRRRKLLAHRDRVLALNPKATRLLPVSTRDVEELLGVFADVMDQIHRAFTGSSVVFAMITGSPDADHLVAWLSIAFDLEERRRERARRGKSLPEDFADPSVP